MDRISPHVVTILVALLAIIVADHVGALRSRGRDSWMRDEARGKISSRKEKQKQRRSDKPNIVFVITDDQDTELGNIKIVV